MALNSSRCVAQSKKASYWKSEIHSAGNNARHVWHTVDNLLGEAKSGAKPTFSSEDITTPTSTRKSLMSGLWSRQRHRRSTPEVTYRRTWTGRLQDREHWRCYNGSQSSAQQTVCVRPSTDLAPERSHYHPCTLHHNNFQLIDCWGTFSSDMEARYCYAAIEESWAGRDFSIKLSSGFKSSIPFESPRKDCQPSTYRLPQRVSLVSRCSVGIQMMSFNGNCSIESIVRYRWCDRQWHNCAIMTTWFNGGFRHCRPWHFGAATRSYIRFQWRSITRGYNRKLKI